MKLTQLTPILLLTLPTLGSAAGNISPTDKYAWSTNAGWVNFSPINGGVTVATDHLEGYAWAENIGWLKLGNYTGGGNHTYGNTTATDYGVNIDAAGNLSGYAWSTNVGWIKFDPANGGVTVKQTTTGLFDGYAWSENVGWIHFQNANPAYTVQYIPNTLTAQTITFTMPASATVGEAPLTLSATATSMLPVTLASTTPEVCTVNVTTLTPVSSGTCTVTADQAGDANYNAAPQVSQNITVNSSVKPQTITFTSPASATVGGAPLTLSATATSGLTVKFASTTPGVCTINGTTLTPVSSGTCTVTADQAGDANYNAASQVSQNITVNPPVTPPPVTDTPPLPTSGVATADGSGPTNNGSTNGTTIPPAETTVPVVTPAPVVTLVPMLITGANFACATTGDIGEVCNYGGQEVTDLNVLDSGKVSNGVVSTTVVNTGWVSNFTITATGQLKGGVVTGYIKNDGEIRDFKFVGMSILGGTLGGVIENNSKVGGYFQDVTLLANTQIIGGTLKGTIKGDKKAPALLEKVRVKSGSKLSGVKLGKGVILEKGVVVE